MLSFNETPKHKYDENPVLKMWQIINTYDSIKETKLALNTANG
jgi:hypothetical protein